MDKIREFKGKYSFLSNFYPSSFIINGITFPTVEHYYQANKADNSEDFFKILNLEKPGETKKAGKKIQICKNWDQIKFSIMYIGLLNKFKQNIDLRNLLIATKEQNIIEGNYWGDKIWGVCLKTNEGENNLGIMLMNIRSIFNSYYFVRQRLKFYKGEK
jgi:ribA/ribD-fused uncharacterized protein